MTNYGNDMGDLKDLNIMAPFKQVAHKGERFQPGNTSITISDCSFGNSDWGQNVLIININQTQSKKEDKQVDVHLSQTPLLVDLPGY